MRRWVTIAIIALLVMVLGAACWNRIGQPANPADQPVVQITPGVPFTLKSGQKSSYNNDEVIVSFARISEDSRCPKNVECFWEGQVTAVFRVVVQGEGLGDLSLTLGRGGSATTQFKSYTLTLKAIDPYPVSTDPIKPADYAATLVLSHQ